MDIERVNDFTLKFFISYRDIEKRGFDREEIWYNRERGEELFWEMMDEAKHQESFPLEGPLWIQVQALEKGLEIIVTRAQMSKDGSKLELPLSNDKHLDIPVSDDFENLLSEALHPTSSDMDEDDASDLENHQDGDLTFLVAFQDFEDIITLSHQLDPASLETTLYAYNDNYYLFVTFFDEFPEEEQDNHLSRILEYGFEATITIHVVQEYGKEIISTQALSEIRKNFPLIN